MALYSDNTLCYNAKQFVGPSASRGDGSHDLQDAMAHPPFAANKARNGGLLQEENHHAKNTPPLLTGGREKTMITPEEENHFFFNPCDKEERKWTRTHTVEPWDQPTASYNFIRSEGPRG